MHKDTGRHTRVMIQQDRAREAEMVAYREKRIAFHANHGDRMSDGSLYMFDMCDCWGCKAPAWCPPVGPDWSPSDNECDCVEVA